jgi:hypothetical protein
MCLEDSLNVEPGSVDLPSLASEYAYNLYTITWPHTIYIFVVANNIQRVWGLPFRYEFWQLLKFDILLICEVAVFMHDMISVFLFAVLA